MTEYTYSYLTETYKIDFDDDINLPALPEGQFWRVKTDSLGAVVVELRRKGIFGSSHLVDNAYPDVVNLKEIQYAACRVVVRGRGRKAENRLLGDYPPKKLS